MTNEEREIRNLQDVMDEVFAGRVREPQVSTTSRQMDELFRNMHSAVGMPVGIISTEPSITFDALVDMMHSVERHPFQAFAPLPTFMGRPVVYSRRQTALGIINADLEEIRSAIQIDVVSSNEIELTRQEAHDSFALYQDEHGAISRDSLIDQTARIIEKAKQAGFHVEFDPTAFVDDTFQMFLNHLYPPEPGLTDWKTNGF